MKTASDIIKTLQAAPANEPAEVKLTEAGTAIIAACKNPFRAGFAIVVISAIGHRYGVAGFKTRPSQSDLAAAIDNATNYATAHRIA